MALIKIKVAYTYEIWDDEGTSILESSNESFKDYDKCLHEATDVAFQLTELK